MWVTVHTISGMAAGAGIRMVLRRPARPTARRAGRRGVCADIIVAAAGPTSHAVFDAVPHWDYTRHRLRPLWATIDVTVSVATLLAAKRAGFGRGVLLAGALAALPDADVFDAALPGHRDEHGRPRRRLFPSHRPGYPHGRTSLRKGTLVQLGILATSLAVLSGARVRSGGAAV